MTPWRNNEAFASHCESSTPAFGIKRITGLAASTSAVSVVCFSVLARERYCYCYCKQIHMWLLLWAALLTVLRLLMLVQILSTFLLTTCLALGYWSYCSCDAYAYVCMCIYVYTHTRIVSVVWSCCWWYWHGHSDDYRLLCNMSVHGLHTNAVATVGLGLVVHGA